MMGLIARALSCTVCAKALRPPVSLIHELWGVCMSDHTSMPQMLAHVQDTGEQLSRYIGMLLSQSNLQESHSQALTTSALNTTSVTGSLSNPVKAQPLQDVELAQAMFPQANGVNQKLPTRLSVGMSVSILLKTD